MLRIALMISVSIPGHGVRRNTAELCRIALPDMTDVYIFPGPTRMMTASFL